MNLFLETPAVSGGTYQVQLDLVDQDEIAIDPTTVTWTLTDSAGNVINGRENVEVSNPTSTVTIFLSGDDLLIPSDNVEQRIISVVTRYDNDLADDLTNYLNVYFTIGQDSVRSILFLRTPILAEIRAQHFALLNKSGTINTADVTDAFIWNAIRTSESQLERALGVFLSPVTVLPDTATAEEITSLVRRGRRYRIDPGYDYEPNDLVRSWAWITTKYKPIISISKIELAQPITGGVSQISNAWIHHDSEAGVIQIVPTLNYFGSFLPALGYRSYPQALKITYQAGLVNALGDYPEIREIIIRQAVSTIISSTFSDVAGTVSIDGMSQNISSPQFDEFRTTTDGMIYRLRNTLSGIQMRVL